MTDRKPATRDAEPPRDEQPETRAARKNAPRIDTTVEGGRYQTADGRLVDANGKPLEGEK